MKRKLTWGIGVLGVLAVASVFVLSLAAFDRDASPPAKTKVLSIPACAFQEVSSEANFYREGSNLSTYDSMEYYCAPLVLPNRTVIKKLVLYYYDNDANNNFTIVLNRVSNSNQTTTMFHTNSYGAASGIRSIDFTDFNNERIDNVNYLYYLRLTMFDSNYISLHQVKVYYRGKW